MRFDITTPATGRILDFGQMDLHIRDVPTEHRDLILDYIDAATINAENAMGTSLLQRSITAVFYEGEKIYLPRGPVISITSVTDFNGQTYTQNNQYFWERFGRADKIRFQTGFTYPLTVVYVAGYANAAAVPADIRLALRQHVATMYANSESISADTLRETPQSLADFYRLNSREVGIG